MYLCEERARNSYPVQSDSSTKVYIVTLFNGPPTCTCPAFAIGKNRSVSVKPGAKPGKAWCKHIDKMFDMICDWTSSHSEVKFRDYKPFCPQCDCAAVWDGDLEEVEEVASSEVLSSLQDMIKEVEGR